MSKRLRLSLLGGLALAASGCTPEALVQIDASFQANSVLLGSGSSPVLQAVQTANTVGTELAGAAIALLGIYL